jgi:4-oxalocrotonate tautomerase
MPYINLKLVGKLTTEQKEIIAGEFSDTLFRVAGKPKDKTYLVIDEVDSLNWAEGDALIGKKS